MAKEKKFIEETVFKKKKIADVFEDLYQDFETTKSDINEMTTYMFENYKLDKADLLQAMPVISKMMDTKNKCVDNMIKLSSVLQKAVAVENRPVSKEEASDEISSDLNDLLAQINKNEN